MEEFLPEIASGYKAFAFLIGSGGVTTIVAAWLGWRSNKSHEALPPSIPIQIESPWMVQNLLGMVHDIRELRTDLAALIKVTSDLTIQVNTFKSLLDRSRH